MRCTKVESKVQKLHGWPKPGLSLFVRAFSFALDIKRLRINGRTGTSAAIESGAVMETIHGNETKYYYERNHDTCDSHGEYRDRHGLCAETRGQQPGRGGNRPGQYRSGRRAQIPATPPGSQTTLNDSPDRRKQTTIHRNWRENSTREFAKEEPASVPCGVDFGGGISASG
jgi:hypothetical protein